MKVLFCGTVVPNEIEFQTNGISAAGNRFQNNFIFQLQKAGHDVRQCSYIGVRISEGIADQLKKDQNPRRQYVIKNDRWLSSLWKYRKLVKSAMENIDIVICYNVIYAWLLLPVWAKQKHKKSVVILADYSESISYSSLIRKCYAWMQLRSMRLFDRVVGLSGNIELMLKKRQQFVFMEGGIQPEFYDAFTYRAHEEGTPLTLMYSGLLGNVPGVELLLEVMKHVKRQDIRLVVTGKGPLENAVQQACTLDKRICYAGNLPYEDYVKQLQKADVLLNPRNMDLPENRNNFPSKIMDYLAAGKTIISTRFAGWEKFSDNIIFTDCTVQGLAEAIERIALEDDANRFVENRRVAAMFLWPLQIVKIVADWPDR